MNNLIVYLFVCCSS